MLQAVFRPARALDRLLDGNDDLVAVDAFFARRAICDLQQFGPRMFTMAGLPSLF